MLRFRAWGPFAALAACCAAPVFADKGPPSPGQPAPVARVAPLSPEAMVEAMQAERDAYTRRLDICTQLRRVAAETNNAKLETEALQLEQMAEMTYKQRVAKLGVKSDPRSPLSQLEALDRALGTGTAVNPLTAAKPAAPASTPTAQSRTFREVKP